MRLFDYSKLKPGMKTAAPIFSKDRLLLDANIELSSETIRRLPVWGIYHVFVHTDDDRSSFSAA